MRIVFMGSPHYVVGIMDAILGLGHEIVGVYTQPDKPAGRGRAAVATAVKSFALARGLRVFQPLSFRDSESRQELARLEPDIIVVAAYGKLLPPAVLDLPPYGCLNVHPSLLPRFRGPSPVASAILEGSEPTGATIMLLDDGMDTGPILAAKELRGWVGSATTPELTEKLFQQGTEMLADVLPAWLGGVIRPQAQDHGLATLTRKLEKADGEADWTLPAQDLERRRRAYTPWPGLYTTWGGKVIKVLGAEVVDDSAGLGHREYPAGTVVSGPGPNIGVVSGKGVLEITWLQMEGKRAMSAGEFLRGYPELPGSTLPS